MEVCITFSIAMCVNKQSYARNNPISVNFIPTWKGNYCMWIKPLL